MSGSVCERKSWQPRTRGECPRITRMTRRGRQRIARPVHPTQPVFATVGGLAHIPFRGSTASSPPSGIRVIRGLFSCYLWPEISLAHHAFQPISGKHLLLRFDLNNAWGIMKAGDDHKERPATVDRDNLTYAGMLLSPLPTKAAAHLEPVDWLLNRFMQSLRHQERCSP